MIKYLIKLMYWAGFKNFIKVAVGLFRMHFHTIFIGRGRGLAKFLPMNQIMKLHIDPASTCNFKCFFCLQTDPKKLMSMQGGIKRTVMPLSIFKKLIDDLELFDQNIDEFIFGTYGEPLLHNKIHEMIAYAKKSNRIREVSMVTNGSFLFGERMENIAKSGLDKIRISIEAMSDAKYFETTLVKQSFSDIISNIKAFKSAVKLNNNNTFIYAKILDTGLSMTERRDFFKIFTNITDACAIENLTGLTPKARKMFNEPKYPKDMPGFGFTSNRKVCPSPFYSLSIHANGDVGVCCADWYHKTKVGSIKDQSLKQIWNSKELKAFRLEQLIKSWKEVDGCKGCETVGHYTKQEDLDHKIPELIKIYSKPTN